MKFASYSTTNSLPRPRSKPARPRSQTRPTWIRFGTTITSTTSTKPKTHIDPEFVLAKGDPDADPEILLNRKTPTGLNEHELLLALNERNLDDLQSFHGFGPRVAQKVIEFRASEKFFSSLDELVRVPLIGPTRFLKLVGRESQFYTLALHAAMRRPAPLTLRVKDLQPLIWPAPGIPRIYLGTEADQMTEQGHSQSNDWFLQTRRIGAKILFVHSSSHLVSGWAKHLVKALPRALRRALSPTK